MVRLWALSWAAARSRSSSRNPALARAHSPSSPDGPAVPAAPPAPPCSPVAPPPGLRRLPLLPLRLHLLALTFLLLLLLAPFEEGLLPQQLLGVAHQVRWQGGGLERLDVSRGFTGRAGEGVVELVVLAGAGLD